MLIKGSHTMFKSKYRAIIKKVSFYITAVLFVLIASSISAWADQGSRFSIEALDGDGNSSQQGYYHVVQSPGSSATFGVKVYNYSDEEITVRAEVNPASTNDNGIPSYLHQENIDDSLKYRMDELVKLNSYKVLIPANDFVILKGEIMFPKESFDGDILGGIRFTQKETNEQNQTIAHEVAYTIGILLNQENGKSVENQLELLSVDTAQRNYRTFIEAAIQNSAAAIIHDLSIQAKVFQENRRQPVYESESKEMRMAPNSNFAFGIPTGEVAVQAGNYRLEMLANADGKEYQFTQEFTITEQEAKELNSNAVNIEESRHYLLYVVLAVLTGLVLFLLVVLYKKSKRGDMMN